mgnify:CR=1 FL=1
MKPVSRISEGLNLLAKLSEAKTYEGVVLLYTNQELKLCSYGTEQGDTPYVN